MAMKLFSFLFNNSFSTLLIFRFEMGGDGWDKFWTPPLPNCTATEESLARDTNLSVPRRDRHGKSHQMKQRNTIKRSNHSHILVLI